MNGGGGREWRRVLVRLGVVLGAGLLLARLGPFGTFDDLSLPARLSYWVGLTLLMWLQGIAALAVIQSTASGRRLSHVARLVGAGIAGAVPTAFEVAWAEMLLRVQRDLTLVDVLGIYGDVVLLSVPLLLLTHGFQRADPKASAEVGAEAENDADWLLAGLPASKRGRLLAISSEDHYVRVRTSSGSDLVHMRFSDAIERLGDAGAQVHRGWWIANGAVRAHRREGDRMVAELVDGTEVPISRSYAVAARNAGLIRDG